MDMIYINSTAYKVSCDLSTSLSDFIRDHVGLKGTKVMCREGGCGSCIVTVTCHHAATGKPKMNTINSCLCPLGSVLGCLITTIEGVGNQHKGFHPIQKAIADHNGSQCGYCTPGMVMNMYGVLYNKPKPSYKEVEQSFDGNLCRCTGYQAILNGVNSLLSTKELLDIEDLGKVKCPLKNTTNFESSHWKFPANLNQVFDIFNSNRGKSVKLVYGNTSSGFYKTKLKADVIVNIKGVSELYNVQITTDGIELGANLTMTDMISELTKVCTKENTDFCYISQSLVPMLYKIGGTAVRNASCWAGNLMLRHKYNSFISDIFTPLEALQAKITVASSPGTTNTYTPTEFLNVDMYNKVIVSVTLPPLRPTTDRFQTVKIMPRAANSLSVINAGFYIRKKEPNGTLSKIEQAKFVFGGVGSNMVRAKNTEVFIQDKEFTKKLLKECLDMIVKETGLRPDQYQCVTARNLLFSFLRTACDPSINLEQFYANNTEEWQGSCNSYDYEKKEDNFPIGQPTAKFDSLLQCSGEAQYVGDQPHLEKELQGCCVLSKQAKAKIDNIDVSRAEELSGVVKVITAKDIVGDNMMDHDGEWSSIPLLAEKESSYAGQIIAIVLAETLDIAQHGASLVTVTYKELQPVIIDIEEAVNKNYSHQMNYGVKERGNVVEAMAGADRVITGQVKLNTQYHFFLENPHCLVVPYDDVLDIWITSQGPGEAQKVASIATAKKMSSIHTNILRLGGGFGGKLTYSFLLAALTAVSAQCVNRPVRLSWNLEQCMKIMGKRTPCLAKYKVIPDVQLEMYNIQLIIKYYTV